MNGGITVDVNNGKAPASLILIKQTKGLYFLSKAASSDKRLPSAITGHAHAHAMVGELVSWSYKPCYQARHFSTSTVWPIHHNHIVAQMSQENAYIV